jgi:hypothetical protein
MMHMYCSVSEQVDKVDLGGQARVFQLELGEVFTDRGIPLGLVLSNKLPYSGGSERLGQRGDVGDCLKQCENATDVINPTSIYIGSCGGHARTF